jgi:coenzyme F420-reducing hydrogenase alpha subunit
MAAKNERSRRRSKIGVGVSVGLAIAAAAIAGAYLMGDKGKKPRREIKSWTLKAKGEVLEGLEKLEVINEEAYKKIVDEVSKRYRVLKHVDKKELALMAAELRSQWGDMQKEWERARRTERESRRAKRRAGKSSWTRKRKTVRPRRKK